MRGKLSVPSVLPIIMAAALLLTSCRTPQRQSSPPPDLHKTVTRVLVDGEVSGENLDPVVRYPKGTLKVVRRIVRLPDGRRVLDGAYTEYYPNGRKKLAGRFDNGLKHGTFTTWASSGTMATRRHFTRDVESGTYEAWDDRGRKTWEVHYVNGKPHGTFTSYYPSGKRRGQGSCVNGKQHGLYVLRDETGRIVRTTHYINGQRQNQTGSDSD